MTTTNDAQPHLTDGVEIPGGYRSYCPIYNEEIPPHPVESWRYEAEADADDCITPDGEPGSTAAPGPSPIGQMVMFNPCGHAWHSAIHVSVDLIVRLADDESGAAFALAFPPEKGDGGNLIVESEQ